MNRKNVAVAGGEKKGEEEECYKRICENARENMQNVPFAYFVNGNDLWCEREGLNPAIYAERKGAEWIAFFENEKKEERK
jgi:hypothetical protein